MFPDCFRGQTELFFPACFFLANLPCTLLICTLPLPLLSLHLKPGGKSPSFHFPKEVHVMMHWLLAVLREDEQGAAANSQNVNTNVMRRARGCQCACILACAFERRNLHECSLVTVGPSTYNPVKHPCCEHPWRTSAPTSSGRLAAGASGASERRSIR